MAMNVQADASRPVVLLTDAIHPDARAQLEHHAQVLEVPRNLTEARADEVLRTLARSADAIIVRRKLPDDIFEEPSRLRAVVRHGAGVDIIPVESATNRGIPVANIPGGNANSVAEFAIAGMLALSRRLAEFDQAVRNFQWRTLRDSASSASVELRGKSLGIIGFGQIGRRVAEIAGAGFGMEVRANTSTPSRLPEHIACLSIQELISVSDFLVVCCPLTSQTRGMINASTLSHAKPGLVLVNVARGAVINEADMSSALEAGILGGAVLDVFEAEPLPTNSDLRKHPRVLLTPHLAGITRDSDRVLGMTAVDIALRLLRGEKHDNVINL